MPLRSLQTLVITLISAVSILSLSGCSTFGNVVPKTGPTMEQTYDSMGKHQDTGQQRRFYSGNSMDSSDLDRVRESSVGSITRIRGAAFEGSVPSNAVSREFHKLPNPELRMYVFPHLAGNDQVPIPGYTTAFNAYNHDHYALPNEVERG